MAAIFDSFLLFSFPDCVLVEMVLSAIPALWFLNECCYQLCHLHHLLVYKRHRTLAGAAIGLILGSLAMTSSMLLWNYIITPIYMNLPREEVVKMLVPIFLPFNLIKSGLNAALTMLLYKPVVTDLRKRNLVPERETDGRRSFFNFGVVLTSLFVIITCILFILALR